MVFQTLPNALNNKRTIDLNIGMSRMVYRELPYHAHFPSNKLVVLSLRFSLEEKSQPLQGENLRTLQASCPLSPRQPCPTLLGLDDGFLPKGGFPILDPKPIV
jgi:hypothetical protein